MITTCTRCSRAYEAGSEEQANEPTRHCPACHILGGSPVGIVARRLLAGVESIVRLVEDGDLVVADADTKGEFLEGMRGLAGEARDRELRIEQCQHEVAIADTAAERVVDHLRKGVKVYSADDEECGTEGHELGTVHYVEERGDQSVGIDDAAWYELRPKKPRAVLLEELAAAIKATTQDDDATVARLLEAAAAVVNAGLKV